MLAGCLLHQPLIIGVSDRSQLTLWGSLRNILLIRRLLFFNLFDILSIATVLGLRERSLRFHGGILIVIISLAESFKHWGLGIGWLNFFILLIVGRSLIGNRRGLLRRDGARISPLLLYQLSLSLSKLMLGLLKLFKHFNLLLHCVRLGKLHLHVLLLDCLEFLLHYGELGLDFGSVKLELLLYLLCLDPLLREALLVIVNNLLLVGLGVLGELVYEVAHPLDLRLGIVKELLVL